MFWPLFLLVWVLPMHYNFKKRATTPPTQTRATVRQSVVSRSAKFGIGRQDVGIKALFCVGGERWQTFLVPSENAVLN